jgi:hypothetical protein
MLNVVMLSIVIKSIMVPLKVAVPQCTHKGSTI